MLDATTGGLFMEQTIGRTQAQSRLSRNHPCSPKLVRLVLDEQQNRSCEWPQTEGTFQNLPLSNETIELESFPSFGCFLRNERGRMNETAGCAERGQIKIVGGSSNMQCRVHTIIRCIFQICFVV